MSRHIRTILMSLLVASLAKTAAAASNSDAAKLCQKGGFENWRQSDGVTGFKNTGECVSYAAKGGVLTPPATPVTECGTVITTPGHYILTHDLLCESSVGVSIQANDVEFSMNGHTIASWAASVVLGGNGPQHHITVQGPGVVGGSPNSSIVLIEVSYSTVKDVTATGNRVGLAIVGSLDSVGNKILGNTFTGNEDGLQVLGSSHNEIADNDASNNSTHGILIGGELQYGQLTTNNSVHDNLITGNGLFGLRAGPGGTANVFSNNTVQHTGWLDLLDSNACGVNTWTNNTFSTSFPDCLH